MKKTLFILPLTALFTLALLPVNTQIAPYIHLPISSNPAITRIAAAQLLSLGLAFCMLFGVRLINPTGFHKFWRLGNLGAPASAVKWLGIKTNESWHSVGTGFATVITLATAAFMWLGVYSNTPIAWLEALPWVLLFSATNAFVEEIICRFSLVATLEDTLSNTAICWWSAGIFGGVHFFGTPGGIIGVLMAGFLGWLLAKSMLETRGIGWAWFIHFLQDVVILFAMLGVK